MRTFLASLGAAVRVERLFASAPELNPVEVLWGHLKNHPLANPTPDSLWKLTNAARNALFKARKRPAVIAAFWVQAELVLERSHLLSLNSSTSYAFLQGLGTTRKVACRLCRGPTHPRPSRRQVSEAPNPEASLP